MQEPVPTMSTQQTHDQEAWRRFVARFILILDALLADLIGHMAEQAAALPRWHPRRLALRAVIGEVTRLRDAFGAIPAPAAMRTSICARHTAPRPDGSIVAGCGHGAAVLPCPAAPGRRCTIGRAACPPIGRAFGLTILLLYCNILTDQDAPRCGFRRSFRVPAGTGQRLLCTPVVPAATARTPFWSDIGMRETPGFIEQTVAAIAPRHGATAPDADALRLVDDLQKTIADFAALHITPRFEDEPPSILAALLSAAAVEVTP